MRKNGQSQESKGVSAKRILAILKDQNYRCAISGRPLTPETASLDHRIPLAAGGLHNIDNVWVVHHQINTAKGTLTIEEFVTMCRDVVTHQENSAPANEQSDQSSSAAGPPEMTLFS